MSVRNAFALLLVLCSLALLVGCGSSSPTPVAPPSGGFSVSDLKGTYVFSTSGGDPNGEFLAMAGTLAANGSGGITGGTADLIGLEISAPTPVAQPVTGGSYIVSADGRGQLHFNTTTLNSLGASTGITITLDFVLTSSSHGLVTEYDQNGVGSGTIDLQSTVSQSQLAGSYTFGLSGTGSTASYAAVGSLIMNSDGSGNVTGGVEDINNGGAYTGTGTITAGSFVNVGTGTAPGTAVIASTNTYTYDVYAIDSTHLKFIETDGLLFLSGDAYTQGTSIASGQLVYTMSGVDFAAEAPFAAGGWLTNNSGTIATGLEDYNDGGNLSPIAGLTISGGFTALSGGRSQLSLTGFVNAASNDVPGNSTFAAYPFTYSGGTGIQLLEIDSAGVTSGAAYPQSSTTLAATQGYGLNLSGFNGNGEEDDIAEFVTTSSGFSGIVDLNNDMQSEGQTAQSPGQALDGSYSAPDGNGRGSGTTTNYISNFNFYVVSPTTYILLETDSGQVAVGTFEQQASPSGGTAQPAVSMLRPAVRPHSALRLRK
jgi:hypothetical protein